MDMRWVICFSTLLLAGCPTESVTSDASVTSDSVVTPELSPTPDDSLVFADRGVRQCESDGVSLEASAQMLIDAGVDVIGSSCGTKTGVVYPTVCGGGTGDILVHVIRTVNLPDAESLGFQETSTLIDEAAGTNYELYDCAERFTSD